MVIDVNKTELVNLYYSLEGLPKFIKEFKKTLSKKENELLNKFEKVFDGSACVDALSIGEKITALSLKKKGFLCGNDGITDWYHLSYLFLQDFENVKKQLKKELGY